MYFTADCILKENYTANWIDAGIEKLATGTLFIVSPLWDYYNSSTEKFDREDNDCFYDKGFTDQAFLVDTRKAQAIGFNEYHVRSEMFPIYGGNHFERRVCSYMNNQGLERCVFKNIVFKHEMLVKPGYVRKIGGSFVMNKLRYSVARVKKKLRKKNILVKFLLR